ncbi:MAG: transporter substrate-binding domain-containing protein, partial [Streptococcus sp.]
IKENKKLVVAVSPDYAPFEFKTLVDGKDQVVGSDIKLAQAIADELGVKLEVTTMSFDNVLSSLQAGKADIAISGISVTMNVRKPSISQIPHETQNGIIVRKDQESTYSSLDAFKGKK